MIHHSRIGCIVIDCKTDDLGPACEFWKAALGCDGAVDKDGKYAVLKMPDGSPRVLLQSVDHNARVHLDIETDDKHREAERLAALGAREIGVVKQWIVMEAPTGHRFCLVDPQRKDFPGDAARWGKKDA